MRALLDPPRRPATRAALLALWGVLLLLLVPHAQRAEGTLEVAARVAGSESLAVERQLRERFTSPFSDWAVLVVEGAGRPDAPAGAAALAAVLEGVRAHPAVSGTLSHAELPDTLFLLPGGSYAVVGLDGAAGEPDALIPRLRERSRELERELAAAYPGLTLRWTGDAALNHDVRALSGAQVTAAELRVLPLTLALLLFAFGALGAALLPVAAGFLTIPLALGLCVLVSALLPLSILVVNVVSMIGLGLGIDYGLLMVSRFREGVRAGAGPHAAARLAAHEAGRTVAVSGLSVAIGFAALLLLPLDELRSIGVAGLLVTCVAVAVATLFLPTVLAVVGHRVDWGRVRPDAGMERGRERWRRWAERVLRRPWLVLGLAALPLLLLAYPATRLQTVLPRGEWLPAGMESTAALARLEGEGREGVVHALRVILLLPEGERATGQVGWNATAALGRVLEEEPRVARVQSLPRLTGLRSPDPTVLSRLPAGVLPAFVAADGGAALLEVLPRGGIEPTDLSRLARDLRRLDVEAATGVPGSRMLVGGLPALNADYEDTVRGWLPWVILLVVGTTLLALSLAFRSLLIPLKAVLLNLLSVGAAFGAVVLVFQEGRLEWLTGIGPTEGVFPIIPILVFATVFGLSMDYEVFLVARIAEARRAGMGEEEAIAEGLARTGGVITSAAAVMVVVFGAFTLGDFLLVRMLGFALAVAILVDAALVRTTIGPALLKLAGRWNWWPGR